MNKKIILIFIFAFLIRLIALNQSLWLDEAVTANVVRNFRFSQIVSGFSPNDFHPPLYYLFMKLWTNFFSYSEIALRMPSVLFSLLTGYIVYLIGGIWAATFFLFNPLIIYYSQEARMYMMATFFLTGGLYYFLKSKNLILFNLFLILSFYTFYGSIFFIAAIFFYFLFKKQYKVFLVSCSLFLVSFVLISPLFYQQFLHSRIALNDVINWSLVLGKANIKNLLLIPIKFSVGRISFYPKIIYWIIAGVWGGWVFWRVLVGGLKNKLMLFLFIFPLIIGLVFSFFTPLLQYFRFLYLIPLISIILGINTIQSYNDRDEKVIRLIILFGFTTFSLVYLLNPAFHREDWKSLAKSLPKDMPVYMILSSSDPIQYYSNNFKVNELTSLRVNKLEQEIIVIPYTVDIYGFDYVKILKQSNFHLISEKTFTGLRLENWKKY